MKEKRKYKHGYVYIISSDNEKVKIGKSIQPEKRINDIEKMHGYYLENIHISEQAYNYDELEKEMHLFFSGKRSVGEWFCVSFDEAVKHLNTLNIISLSEEKCRELKEDDEKREKESARQMRRSLIEFNRIPIPEGRIYGDHILNLDRWIYSGEDDFIHIKSLEECIETSEDLEDLDMADDFRMELEEFLITEQVSEKRRQIQEHQILQLEAFMYSDPRKYLCEETCDFMYRVLGIDEISEHKLIS